MFKWLNKHKFLALSSVVTLLVLGMGSAVTISILHEKSNPVKSTDIAVQGNTAKTPDVFTVAPAQKKSDFTSPTFKANFEFNAIAPHWKESNANDNNRTVAIRTSDNGRSWSNWMNIEVMPPQRDNAPHADEVFPEAPIITLGKYFQYKVQLTNSGQDNAPSIRDMNMTYIDSRPTLLEQIKEDLKPLSGPTASAASGLPHVISRADWGNPDPNGDAFRGTSSYWAPTYQQTSQIFIHHTVDSNYTSQTDGASLVRAIWQYHTYTLGWGDIGYNYLVDEAGNIYEGRAHGDNVVGGHVYGYNSGSMGVALLGCFQSADTTCQQLDNNNIQPPSNAMLNSLTDLLAWKTTTYAIDPQAQHSFCKYDGTGCLNLYTISGHRDAYPTACPGDLAYQDLQTIRDTTATKKANQYYYAAEQVNFPTVSLGDNNQLSVTMQFKNTGTETWYNSGASPIHLGTANSPDHTSVFEGSGWLSANRPANLNETSVAPGSIGSFTFNIANPPGYTDDWMEYFRLVAEGTQDFGNFYGLPITTRTYSVGYNSQATYTDSSKSTPVDISHTSPGQQIWAVISVTNTGNTTWYNSGNNPIRLGTDNTVDHNSPFCTAAWISCNRPTALMEASVAPGAIGTFEFPISIPAGVNSLDEYFTPVAEGIYRMSNPTDHFSTTINSNYSYSFGSEQAYTDSSKTSIADVGNLSPGQNIFFSISLTNTGDTTWYNSGRYSLDLGTANPSDRSSAFYNSTWLSPNRPTSLKESAVAPGQTGTFEATYTVPYGNSSYQEYLRPVVEGLTWLNDIGLSLPAKVNTAYTWSFASEQAYTDNTMTTPVDTTNLSPGQRFYFVVAAKNTGTATWYKDSKYPLRLGTYNPQDHISKLYDSSWLSQNRSSGLSETSVAPGQIGHFGAYYDAPAQTGTYNDFFRPVADGATWLNDLGLYIPVVVK